MKHQKKSISATVLASMLLALGAVGTAAAADTDSTFKPTAQHEVFKGRVIPLYAYLTNERTSSETTSGNLSKDRDSSETGRDETRSGVTSKNQPIPRDSSRNQPGQTGTSSYGQAGSMTASLQPLALVTTEDRLFGSNKECYLLVFDPGDQSSQRASEELQKMISGNKHASNLYSSTTSANTSQRDRLDPADTTGNEDRTQVKDVDNQNETKAEDREAARSQIDTGSSLAGASTQVSVIGRMVEKDGIKAIVVTSVSPAATGASIDSDDDSDNEK